MAIKPYVGFKSAMQMYASRFEAGVPIVWEWDKTTLRSSQPCECTLRALVGNGLSRFMLAEAGVTIVWEWDKTTLRSSQACMCTLRALERTVCSLIRVAVLYESCFHQQLEALTTAPFGTKGLHLALKVLRQRRIRPANGGEGVGEVRLEDLRAGRRGWWVGGGRAAEGSKKGSRWVSMAFEVSEGGGVLASQAGGVVNASQAGGVVNTLRECSTYTVGEGNMGRGLSDVDGESVYASTGQGLYYTVEGRQAAGVANAGQAGGVVNTLTASPCTLQRVKACTITVEGQSSCWCGQYVDGESVYASTGQVWYNPLKASQAGGVAMAERFVKTVQTLTASPYVDGESVYASARSRPVLYTLKASQAAGVANTLRECSTYNVGVINMGRGLSDVDGESVYASARSRPVLYPLKAGQAAGVANTLRECSTYNVGVINMGRGLSDVDGESVYASARSRPVLYPLKAGQAGGVVNVNLGQALYGSLRCFNVFVQQFSVFAHQWVVVDYFLVFVDQCLEVDHFPCVRRPILSGGQTNKIRVQQESTYVQGGRQVSGVACRVLEVGWGFCYTWLKSCNKSMHAQRRLFYSMSQGEATTDVQSTFTEVDSSLGMYASLVDMGFHASWLDVQDVDGESVYASTGQACTIPVEGWASCGVVNTLEVFYYTVGRVNMGRGLEAGQAGGVVNRGSTYTVGVINMGRGLKRFVKTVQ
ncbi:hypothetical protein CPB85DRAFT_1255351, partial [Mucidula mucida]